jgi:FkbM family methyltransferase
MIFMKGKLAENWLKLIRLYTFYSPVRKGKVRLYEFAMNLCSEKPQDQVAITFDGRKINVNLASRVSDPVYFLGEYEREISKLVIKIVKEGDVCFDVGANYGWYATLFSSLCGNTGQVHAFEPLPGLFEKLQRNMELAGYPENVFLEPLALGDENRIVTLHTFPGLTTGHNSLSAMDQDNYETTEVKMVTLDSYLSEKGLTRVDFLKIDIEGAELLFLHGARSLFKIDRPPFLLMEMALNTSKGFGYIPNDLIEFIRSQAAYRFFTIDESDGRLTEIEGFAADDIGANVLCIPEGRMAETGNG